MAIDKERFTEEVINYIKALEKKNKDYVDIYQGELYRNLNNPKLLLAIPSTDWALQLKVIKENKKLLIAIDYYNGNFVYDYYLCINKERNKVYLKAIYDACSFNNNTVFEINGDEFCCLNKGYLGEYTDKERIGGNNEYLLSFKNYKYAFADYDKGLFIGLYSASYLNSKLKKQLGFTISNFS